MGCLQKSVWISPRDIRPDFDDLCEAASIGDVALLFEAQTVLGLDPIRVVEQAWSMDQLYSRQEQYLRTFGDKPARIKVQNLPDLQREQLLRHELLAYLQVMDMDPLLPRVLWPDNYRGRDVFDVHRALRGEIARAM